MNFSKEQSLFVIKNSAALEGGVYDHIEKPLFRAINTRLEKRLGALGGWKGVYKLVSGETDETYFAPVVWPESQDGRFRACYKLNETGDQNNYWLSCALGVQGVKLCFRLWVHGGLGGRTKGEVERKLLTVSQAAAVREAGVLRSEDATLYLPFSFDAEVMAAEYPAVDKTIAPLDAALEKLLQVHPHFDAAVRELAKM